MDLFAAMRLFVRIVERHSFTLAADDLGVPRQTATDVIKKLEARMGTRLLNRTTRTVSPTLEGESYYQRCVALLADIEETEAAAAESLRAQADSLSRTMGFFKL